MNLAKELTSNEIVMLDIDADSSEEIIRMAADAMEADGRQTP